MKVLEGSEKLYDNGVVSTTQYKVAQSAKVMDMLSNRLYKDKVKAVIRELSTNAWDAHVEAGNTNAVPFIKLPTFDDPTFSIRDYGTGLSPEKLEEIYTTYGESTKTHSNDYNGCMGIGSKSPFAYCRSFTTTSFYNGKKYVYINAKDAANMPTLRKVGEYDTDEPNGLLVSFATESKDTHEFTNKAKEILKWFPKQFKVTNYYSSIIDLDNDTDYAYEGNDGSWKIRNCRSTYDHESHIIMGYIRYPIDSGQFARVEEDVKNNRPTDVDNDWYQYYQEIDKGDDKAINYQEVLNCGFEFSVPIGTIEMDISREGLQYSPATVKTLKELMDKGVNKVSDVISKRIEGAKCLYDARIEYANVAHYSELRRIAKNLTPSWNGQEFKPKEYVRVKDFEKLRRYHFYPNQVNLALKDCSSMYDADHIPINEKNGNLFFEDDMEKGSIAAMRRHIESVRDTMVGSMHRSFLIKFSDDQQRQDFIDDLGIMEDMLIKTSTVPKTKRKPTVTKKNYQVFVYSSGWVEESIDFTKGGFYVELNNWHAYEESGVKYPSGAFSNLVQQLGRFALKTGLDVPEIVGVKTKSVPKFRKAKNWKCFVTWVREKVQEHIDNLDIDDDIPKMLEYKQYKSKYQYSKTDMEKLIEFISPSKNFIDLVKDKESFEKLVDKFQNYGIIYADTQAKMDTVSTLATIVNVTTDFYNHKEDGVLTKMYDELMDKYYILELVTPYSWDSHYKKIADFVNMVNNQGDN